MLDMSTRTPNDYERAIASVVKITMDTLAGPVCVRCKHPVGTLVHIIACAADSADRICFECDHKWTAADPDGTERCPREGCTGTGEPR